MTEFTLHEVWEMMRDLSAHAAGDTSYKEAAEAHFATVDKFDEEAYNDFNAKTEVIRASLDALNVEVYAMSQQIIEERGLPESQAAWTSQDIATWLAAAQTKGEYMEALSVAILSIQNMSVYFALVEPEWEVDVEGQ